MSSAEVLRTDSLVGESACFLILLPMAPWPDRRQVPLRDKADIIGRARLSLAQMRRRSQRTA